jgi:glutathione S-transferase
LPSTNLRLYADAQFASPYAMSAFVALHEKGLSFELATIDLANNANLEPEYAASSLTQRVPTLVHDSFALSESSAITEYLDEVFREPCYTQKMRSGARGHVKYKRGCEAISCP